MHKLLVIKQGGLGDFILAFRSFQVIRQHFPDAEITLLTTRPFQRLAVASKWFNRVWVDERPKVGKMHQLFSLRARIIAAEFDLVIDLHNSERTSLYYHMLFPYQPPWSGMTRGCSHRCGRRKRQNYHAIAREVAQLAQLDLTPVDYPDLSWLNRAFGSKSLRITRQNLLLAPGCAPTQNRKSWPVESYAEVANLLVERGWQIILIGTKADIAHNRQIRNLCSEVRDLTDQINLLELAVLGQQAGYALGNNNGVMRLLANCGCRSLILQHSDKTPLAKHVKTLHRDDIRLIESADVLSVLDKPEE